MNKLGIISGLACLAWALFYDWQIVGILLLFFIATKTDTVILIDQKIELLVNIISKKL